MLLVLTFVKSLIYYATIKQHPHHFRCAKIQKILDEKARENGDDLDGLIGVEHDHEHDHQHFGHEHHHKHFGEEENLDENGMTELLSMQVEAYMDTE